MEFPITLQERKTRVTAHKQNQMNLMEFPITFQELKRRVTAHKNCMRNRLVRSVWLRLKEIHKGSRLIADQVFRSFRSRKWDSNAFKYVCDYTTKEKFTHNH